MRQAIAATAELLLQPRFTLTDSRLVACEATAQRTRRAARTDPRAALAALGDATRNVTRDGAMLRQACSLAAGCGPAAGWTLSLQITEVQAASGLLGGLISNVLAETGLAPERLELEFSEGSLQADETDLLYLLASLRDLGVGLALGGFGSNVSSLTLLRRRSVAGLLSTLKLHPQLLDNPGLQGVPGSRERGHEPDRGFLTSLIATAHALGLMVVGSGVSEEASHRLLRACGCDQATGSWLGEPMAAHQAVQRLRLGGDRGLGGDREASADHRLGAEPVGLAV